MSQSIKPLSSSFRDPDGFLFKENGELYRQVNPIGVELFNDFNASELYRLLVKKNWLVPHEVISSDEKGIKIKPELISFISYPYEWSFSQWKDAALLTIAIQKLAIKHGYSLKDASAYNVQFRNGKPIFIDTLSFEKLKEGNPWVAYKQFCQHFLAPLALASYTDVRLNHLFKSFIDGIPLDLAASILPRKSKLNLTLFTHIHWHSKSQLKHADDQEVKAKKAMSNNAMMGLLEHLKKAIKKLKWKPADTEWGDYYNNTNYTNSSLLYKKSLVKDFLAPLNAKFVWDMGANDGFFSRVASEQKIPTVAFDIDPIAVEKNYLAVKENKEKFLQPLLLDITNPSPGIGWGNTERSVLNERGRPDCIFALALIHHLAISNNVPLENLAAYFANHSDHLIIEFVPKSDSKVKTLLATREDIFPNYNIEGFEDAFSKSFEILKKETIEGSERTLFLLKKK